jgi:hypothetical protein
VDFEACLRLPDAAGPAALASTGAFPDTRSGPLLGRLSLAADLLPETTLSAHLRGESVFAGNNGAGSSSESGTTPPAPRPCSPESPYIYFSCVTGVQTEITRE